MQPLGFTPDNVVVVGFADDDRAYEALTSLKQLDTQGQMGLREAAVVVRDEDGHLDVKDKWRTRDSSAPPRVASSDCSSESSVDRSASCSAEPPASRSGRSSTSTTPTRPTPS